MKLEIYEYNNRWYYSNLSKVAVAGSNNEKIENILISKGYDGSTTYHSNAKHELPQDIERVIDRLMAQDVDKVKKIKLAKAMNAFIDELIRKEVTQ